MLKLLCDEHISTAVALGLKKLDKSIFVCALSEWESGNFLSLSDQLILEEATAQQLTLVTYDRRTIPPLLKMWAEAGRSHGGVIFVDEKTIPLSDFGGLIQSLRELYQKSAKWDWKNRICFLRR